MKIIGLTGYARSGKDTVARMIRTQVNQADHDCEILAFAEPMKEERLLRGLVGEAEMLCATSRSNAADAVVKAWEVAVQVEFTAEGKRADCPCAAVERPPTKAKQEELVLR